MKEKELSDREANKLFWKELNKKCLQCINKCKQSSKVTILKCNNYIKIEEN